MERSADNGECLSAITKPVGGVPQDPPPKLGCHVRGDDPVRVAKQGSHGSSDRLFFGVADAAAQGIGGVYFTTNASAASPTFTKILATNVADFAPVKLAIRTKVVSAAWAP